MFSCRTAGVSYVRPRVTKSAIITGGTPCNQAIIDNLVFEPAIQILLKTRAARRRRRAGRVLLTGPRVRLSDQDKRALLSLMG